MNQVQPNEQLRLPARQILNSVQIPNFIEQIAFVRHWNLFDKSEFSRSAARRQHGVDLRLDQYGNDQIEGDIVALPTSQVSGFSGEEFQFPERKIGIGQENLPLRTLREILQKCLHRQ
jgi:hypothetical protein